MKNLKTKLLSLIIAGTLIFDATLAVSADTPVKASTKTAEASSSIASDSKLDLRPIDVTTENGITKISRDNGATWTKASAAKQTTNARLGSAGSAIGSFVLDAFKSTLSSSITSPITSLVSFGCGELMSWLFPSDSAATAAQVQKLQDSIDQVQNQLNEIQSEMSEMLNQLKNEDIKTELQTQISYITSSEDMASLKVALSQFSNEINLINQEPDDTSTSKQKSNDELKFMKAIYNSKINGEDLCSAVQAFGNQVTYVNPSSGKDLFGTFDELAQYSYPWENQGYAPRQRFQASVLALYLQLSTLSQLSLKEANEYDWDWNTSGVSAQAQYQSLLSVSKAVKDMATNETVVERPSNLRYYQVPGHECLLANCTQNWQANATPNIQQIINDPADLSMRVQDAANDLYANGGQTSNSSLDQLKIANTRPTSDWLCEVSQDCADNSTSLYDIFFNKDEGNFIAASGISKGMSFLTNASSDQTGNNVSSGGNGNWWATTTVINDSGQQVSNQTIAQGTATDGGNGETGVIPMLWSWNPSGNYIGLAVLNQGATPVDEDVDSISSVSATNGSASVTMQYPTTTELNDFTATYSINGGTSYPLALTGISGSGANYTLSFDAIPAASSSQSVVITVSYGGKSASATAFTVNPFAAAVAAVNGINYGTVGDALNAAATSGGTVTLLSNVTESDTVTTTSGQTITIDGGNYTLTAPANSSGNSNALTVTGGGTLILKNITLQGGAANAGNSIGLEADSGFSGTVIALGTVKANGGSTGNNMNGVENDGSGTVNISTANGGSGGTSNGAYNGSSGVINVGTAEGTGASGYGVYNSSSGVINVGTATGTNYGSGIYNATSGTVNANTVISDSDEQVINGWAVGGTINVGGQVTGDGAGTINCGNNVKTVKLNAGNGSSCVLDNLTIAASGNTNVGTLPAVYGANGNAGAWFTDASLTTKASSSLSSSTTNLYSTFYSSTPLTNIDTPTNGTSVNGTLNVSGWALNSSGIDRVDVYAYDSNGTPHSLGSVAGSTLTNRSDVAATFANGGYANINNSGYSLAVDTTKLTGGTYTLAIAGIGKNGVVQWATTSVNVTTSQPLTNIDTPTNGTSINGTLNVSGWALNSSGIDRVDMYAFDSNGNPHSLGSVAGSALTNRPDVATAFANDGYANINNSGYSLAVDTTKLAGGTYTLAVAGIGKNGVVKWATTSINLITSQPLVDIDTPTNGTSVNGTLNVSGWALSTSGIDRVDMYAFDSNGTPHSLGSVAGSALTNRSDVATAFANDGYANINNSGYSLSVDTTKLAGGTYTLAVAGIGKNGAVQWETKTIHVATPQALTDIDTPTNDASVNGTLNVSGWVLNTSGIDRVDMYAFDSDGTPHSLGSIAGSALTNRSDVATAFANDGYANINNSGYSLSVDTTKLAAGTYTLSVAGIGKNGVVQWATKTITIQ